MMEEQPPQRRASSHNCLTTIIALMILAMIVCIPGWFVVHEKSDEMKLGSNTRDIYHLLTICLPFGPVTMTDIYQTMG